MFHRNIKKKAEEEGGGSAIKLRSTALLRRRALSRLCRELAVQIKEECDKFGRSSKIKNTCLYGGAPKGDQVCCRDRASFRGSPKSMIFHGFSMKIHQNP